MKRVFKIFRQIIKIEITMNKLDPWLENWLEQENKKGVGYYKGDIDEMNKNVLLLKEVDKWEEEKRYDPVVSLGYDVVTFDFNDMEVRQAVEQDEKDFSKEESQVGIEKLAESFDKQPVGRLEQKPEVNLEEEVNQEIGENVQEGMSGKEAIETAEKVLEKKDELKETSLDKPKNAMQESMAQGSETKAAPGVDKKAIENAPTKEAAIIVRDKQLFKAFENNLEETIINGEISAITNIPSNILASICMDALVTFVVGVGEVRKSETAQHTPMENAP